MDLLNKNRKARYDRVMSRIGNRSTTNLKSSSFVTRHDLPSSVRVGAKTSVSNQSKSDLPVVLNDYVPEASGDKVRRSLVVKPRRTIKSLDPALSPPRPNTKTKEKCRTVPNLRLPESAPVVLRSNGEQWSDTHVKECLSSRSHSRIKELKSEIQAYKDNAKLMRLRSDLYKKCGVVLDDVGNVVEDKAVQAEVEPKPVEQEINTRQNQWLKLIGRTDLLKKDKIKSYRVCSQHFEESMMSEVHIRKLLPHAVPTKCLPTESTEAQPQPSTSKNESNASDVSTQTEDSYFNVISVIKIKDVKIEAQTQIEEPQEEKKLQTTAALSENTPRKRKLHTNLQESERKKAS